ncbi:MAG TPA: anti-sigma regulatory factor [Polyangiaceae bacterium]|jgi:serine/threonine-protein kinase RsbT
MCVEATIPIRHDSDVLSARKAARALATRLRFSSTDLALIATAISEIARNILVYAKSGEMTFEAVEDHARRGIVVIAKDNGPGIADIAQAMQDGYTSGQGLGLGLPGARRLMDEFSIESKAGHGTTIVMKKWTR